MLTLATKITLLRIVLIPLVLLLLYFENPTNCILAAIAFGVAGITDWMDGYVARHHGMVTNMGKFLDPLADKLLICGVLIMLVELGWAPAWVVIIIVSRELVITGLRTIAIDEGIVMAADRYGKLKTVLQIAAIIPLIIHYRFLGLDMHFWGTIILYLSMFMAIFSCINYFRQFRRKFLELHGTAQAGS
ncbi:MAG TPA: CDP-diacylglycerol--glycerol-3-phosphate 3-phosphatidyltransferase [Candidatus Desulfovibrio intestinipullorum]|uniref:CDP-diacylglycerol--glycerol-3-phosphate 3-phosphatidyltransferase n=1 Tax=Candidatus Desulfovibrio intestinipullorum TaxID=2838536 RepID=A0A9D1PYF3_9BACT|nr:CDP-diacylglycerol--glycerol-3-phosphate 3-phosphatidyltransferase [Candidatus Desulfovibrio intestinipullorum]